MEEPGLQDVKIWLLWEHGDYDNWPDLLSLWLSQTAVDNAHKLHHPKAKAWPPRRCNHNVEIRITGERPSWMTDDAKQFAENTQ